MRIECAFNLLSCAFERPHEMHIQGQWAFDSLPAKPPTEVLLIWFDPSNWFREFPHDRKTRAHDTLRKA